MMFFSRVYGLSTMAMLGIYAKKIRGLSHFTWHLLLRKGEGMRFFDVQLQLAFCAFPRFQHLKQTSIVPFYVYIYIHWIWPPHSNSDLQGCYFLIGNPYKPSFTTVTVTGPHPIYTNIPSSKLTWLTRKSPCSIGNSTGPFSLPC